jgi:hypothetical protein
MRWREPHQPGHLRRGGQLDIVRRGDDAKCARLTEELVRQIRSSSKSDSAWAKELGVANTTVRSARLGITWKHVPMKEDQ